AHRHRLCRSIAGLLETMRIKPNHGDTEARRHGEKTNRADLTAEGAEYAEKCAGNLVQRTGNSVLAAEILWREDGNVYRPLARPLREFLDTVAIISHDGTPWERQDESLLVFLEHGCVEKMQAHARQEILREQAGILCGQAYVDENGRYYLAVNSAVAVDAQADSVHFKFHQASWEQVWSKIEPGANVVGWYHTHPGMGVFLSQTDKRTQQLYFQAPWQIAVVIDPVGRETGVFCGMSKVNDKRCFLYVQRGTE